MASKREAARPKLRIEWPYGPNRYFDEVELDAAKARVSVAEGYTHTKARRKHHAFEDPADAQAYFELVARSLLRRVPDNPGTEVVVGADLPIPPAPAEPLPDVAELEAAYEVIAGKPHRGAFFNETWGEVAGAEDAFYRWIEANDDERHPAERALEAHERAYVEEERFDRLVAFLSSVDPAVQGDMLASMRRLVRRLRRQAPASN